MTYTCHASEFAANTHILKMQRLQIKVLRTIGKFPRPTPVRELHMAFQVTHTYDYMTKLCRQQAEVIRNQKMQMFATSEEEKPDQENIRGLLKIGGGQGYDRSRGRAAVVA
jgi:hypothetical protein